MEGKNTYFDFLDPDFLQADNISGQPFEYGLVYDDEDGPLREGAPLAAISLEAPLSIRAVEIDGSTFCPWNTDNRPDHPFEYGFAYLVYDDEGGPLRERAFTAPSGETLLFTEKLRRRFFIGNALSNAVDRFKLYLSRGGEER